MSIEALLERARAARDSNAPLTSIVTELRSLWRDAETVLERWACRTLWQWLQELDGAVSPAQRAELVANGVWSTSDAVCSSWAGSSRRRPECDDDRYLESDLCRLLDALRDEDLPAFREAVAALRRPNLGRVALSLVKRLVATGQSAEALAARSLTNDSIHGSLCLEAVASLLDEDALERAVEAAWRSAQQEMGDNDEARSYRSADWARLLPLVRPSERKRKLEALEALVRRIPRDLRAFCQDHDDLNGVVAKAWADIGDDERALLWADEVLPPDRARVRAEIIVHLAPERRVPEALALLETLHDDDLWGTPLTLAPLSEVVARRALEVVRERMAPEDQSYNVRKLLLWLGADHAAEDTEEAAAVIASPAPPPVPPRAPPVESAQVGKAVYELSLGAGIVDAPACVVALLGSSRAPLARALMDVGPWARVAIMSQSAWGWPYLMECLLVRGCIEELSEDEVREACRVTDAAALAEWLTRHPPEPRRLWDLLEPREREQVMLHVPRGAEWVRTIEEWSAREPPADTRDDLEALEASGGSESAEVAWRWMRIDGERALAAARRIVFDQDRFRTVLGIGLELERGDAVREALMGMSQRYDPAISLVPGARRAVQGGFREEVLAVAHAQKRAPTRIALLAEVGPTVREEIEREIASMIDEGGQVEDAAFGRAWPHVSLEARTRMWMHAFSEAQLEAAPPFSPDTTGVLAATASLMGGEALTLVSWIASFG